MAESGSPANLQTAPALQQLQTLNFGIKKVLTAEEILDSLRSQCLAFQSFQEVQSVLFQNSIEMDTISQALKLFLQDLTRTLGYIIFNSQNSKLRDKECFLKENIPLLEEKIVQDPRTFQETCRIYYNIQNLTEISLKQEPRNPLKTGQKATPSAKKNTQKILKSSIKKEKKGKKSQKSSKLKKTQKRMISQEPEKLLLRLLPHSTETHQLMMKLENFPRLELKVSPNNFLRNINEHLSKKWLVHCQERYCIDYYPDESKWLKNVTIGPLSQKPSPLSENYMINDLFSAYNCPSSKVLYLFYELRDRLAAIKNPIEGLTLKKESNLKKETSFLIQEKEKPTITISTTPNNSKESSAEEENYLFAENLLRNMDLLKPNVKENTCSNFLAILKPMKEATCSNFLNLNDASNPDFLQHSRAGALLTPLKMENSVFSLNETKKSINFSNFSGSFNCFKGDNSEPGPQKMMRGENTSRGRNEEAQTRKDLRHLSKIKDLVDIVGKSYEKMKGSNKK